MHARTQSAAIYICIYIYIYIYIHIYICIYIDIDIQSVREVRRNAALRAWFVCRYNTYTYIYICLHIQRAR